MENRFNFLAGFEKVEVMQGPRTVKSDRCWVDKETRKFFICASLARQLKWVPGTRVNLYHKGRLCVFVPDKVGLFTFKRASSTSATLCLGSMNCCLEIVAITQSHEFVAWVEDDVLFFKPKEEE